MSKIRSFQDLVAWKEGHKLVLEIYKITKAFPKEEKYGFVSQMRRSAISITSNIAEGFKRPSYKEKVRFYFTSSSSLTELQNQLLISRDVGFLSANDYFRIAQQSVFVHKVINGLIAASKKRI